MPDTLGPDAAAELVPLDTDGRQTVAIVGAGFSGTLLALHLLRRADMQVRVVLIERNAQFGRGPAYAAGNSSHLLNVPAAKMSAFHGEPLHFLDWLRANADAEPPCGDTFVPRHMFGRYVRHLLHAEIRGDTLDRLTLVRGDVIDISPDARGLCLSLDRGRALRADRAVLAVGNFPPAPPPVEDRRFYDTAFYKSDPWAADALDGLDPDTPVLLIGTGLTMVDTVISLLDGNHQGPIVALSRRGLLPNRHAAPGGGTLPEPPSCPTGAAALARTLRARCAQNMRQGGSWQAIIDELRPVTTEIWQAMPRQVTIASRPRGRDGLERVVAGRVINCAGPNADYGRIRDGLIRSLLSKGLVRPDALSLGLDVTANCALLDREGAISRRLFAIGPVTRGAFWEMTAVPDIRHQAEFLAGRLAAIGRPARSAETAMPMRARVA